MRPKCTSDQAGLVRPRHGAGHANADDMRVGYVTKMFPRFSETFVLTELLQLERLGYEVEIFSLRPPADGRFHAKLADLRAPVTYLTSSGIRAADLWSEFAATDELDELGPHLDELLRIDYRSALQAVQLARHCRRLGLTHLHAHFASAGTTVARVAARIAGISYGFTAHAKDIYCEVDQDDLRRKLRDAVDVVTVSDFNRDYLTSEFGADADRVRRVYNGLDLDAFEFSDPSERSATIAAVGRLVEKKGFDVLLDALALLLADGHQVDLVLIGSGVLEGALRAQAERLGLADRVTMLGGLPQHRVAEVVANAAVFAAPVWWGRTATATVCRPCCSRRWPWARRASPHRLPVSRRSSSTRSPGCSFRSVIRGLWQTRSIGSSMIRCCAAAWPRPPEIWWRPSSMPDGRPLSSQKASADENRVRLHRPRHPGPRSQGCLGARPSCLDRIRPGRSRGASAHSASGW